MALIIEDRDLKAAHITAEELKLEIAILLYSMGKLSMGKASKLVGLNRIIFQNELAKRKIAVNYDVEELKKDLETLKNVDEI